MADTLNPQERRETAEFLEGVRACLAGAQDRGGVTRFDLKTPQGGAAFVAAAIVQALPSADGKQAGGREASEAISVAAEMMRQLAAHVRGA